MGEIDDVIKKITGTGPQKRGLRPSGLGSFLDLPSLPDPSKIKDTLEQAVENITDLKDVPKTLLQGITEADLDFREASKAFRKARIKGPRKK